MITKHFRATLVVIDAQPIEFKAARHPVFQQEVAELVQGAMDRNWDILIIEYTGAGKTLSRVTEMLEGYARKETVEKANDGGGEDVLIGIGQNNFASGDVFACGTNTHGCVQDTIDEFAVLAPECNIRVVKPGCNDERGNSWNRFKCAANVRLVEGLPAISRSQQLLQPTAGFANN